MILTLKNTPTSLHPWLAPINSVYRLYQAVMDLKRRRDSLRGWTRIRARFFVAYAYARDVGFNLITGTRIFHEAPREFTFTARLKRLRRFGTLKQIALAEFLCDQVLDSDDPDGDHC